MAGEKGVGKGAVIKAGDCLIGDVEDKLPVPPSGLISCTPFCLRGDGIAKLLLSEIP